MTIVEIGLFCAGTWRVEQYSAARAYSVEHAAPRFRLSYRGELALSPAWVEIGAQRACKHGACPKPATASAGRVRWRLITPPDGSFGAQWLEGELSADTDVFGTHTLPFNTNDALSLYLWPSHLFDLEHWRHMHDAVAAELGIVPWSAGNQHRVYVDFATTVLFDDPRAAMQVLDDVKAEVGCVRDLLRRQQAMPSDPNEPLSPERLLLPVWADRRLMDLEKWRRASAEVDDQLKSEKAQRKKANASEREQRELKSARRPYGRIRKRLDELQPQLLAIAQTQRAIPRVPPRLTPAMQYDHRLRRLLGALRPRPDERLADQVTHRLSSHQPVDAPCLFEAWCAVWCVYMLRHAGWTVEVCHRSSTVFEKSLLHISWHARQGDVELWLDWAKAPLVARCETAMELRTPGQAGIEAFGAEQAKQADFAGNWAVWPKRKTPDLLIRVRREGAPGWAVGVGDPTLGNPGKKHKNDKPKTMREYVKALWWIDRDGLPHGCHPAGGFAVLPGPRSAWARLEHEAAKNDCWLICPTPGVVDPAGEAARVWRAYVEMLVAAADRATNLHA